MSKILIDNIKLIEIHKQAIPILRKFLKGGGCHYIAGSLILQIKNPSRNSAWTSFDVAPIDDVNSSIIREAQYLISLMYVKHKSPRHCFYKQAEKNIKEYERIDASASYMEPAGTDAIS